MNNRSVAAQSCARVCRVLVIGSMLFSSVFAYAQTNAAPLQASVDIQAPKVADNVFEANIVVVNTGSGPLNNVMLSWTLEQAPQLAGEALAPGATIGLGNIAEENGKIYFSLLSGEEIVRTLAITLPAATQIPEHRLTVELVDIGGSTLAAATKPIVLAGGGGLLLFDPQFCVLRIGKTPYVSPPILFPDEALAIFCRVTNPSNEAVTAIPMLRAGKSPLYRSDAQVSEIRANPITIPAEASQIVDIEFPSIPAYPGQYDAAFLLADISGAQRSLLRRFSWAVQGASVTLRQASFDKDAYRKGDQAVLSLAFSQSADLALAENASAVERGADPLRWRGTPLQEPRLSVEIKDGKGRSCGKTNVALFPSQEDLLKTTARIPMERNCVDPEAALAISEQQRVLAAMTFYSRSQASTAAALQDNILWYVLGAALLLLLLLAFFYLRRRGKSSSTGSPTDDHSSSATDSSTPIRPTDTTPAPPSSFQQGASCIILLYIGATILFAAVAAVPAHAAPLTPEEQATMIRQLNANLQETREVLSTIPPRLSALRAIFANRPPESQQQFVGRSGETIELRWTAENATLLTLTVVCETNRRGNVAVMINGRNRCSTDNAVPRQIDTESGGFAGEEINLLNLTSPLTATVVNQTQPQAPIKFGFRFTAANRRGVAAGQTGVVVLPDPSAPTSAGAEGAPAGPTAPAAPAAPTIPLLQAITVSPSVLYDTPPANVLRLSWTAAPEAEIGFSYGCRENNRTGFLFMADEAGAFDATRPISCNSIQWMNRDGALRGFVHLAGVNTNSAGARIRFALNVYARAPGHQTVLRSSQDLFLNPAGVTPISAARRATGVLLGDVTLSNPSVPNSRGENITRLTWGVLNPDAQIAISYATPQSDAAYLVAADPQGTYDELARIPPFPMFHALEGSLGIFRRQGFMDLVGVNKTDRPIQMQIVVRASIPGKTQEGRIEFTVLPGGVQQQQAIPEAITPGNLAQQNEPLFASPEQSTNSIAGTGNDAVRLSWQAAQDAFVSLRYECAGAEGVALRFSNSAGPFACGTFQRVTSPVSIVALNNSNSNKTVRLQLKAERYREIQTADISVTITPAAFGTTREGRGPASAPLLADIRIRPRGVLGNNTEQAILEWTADPEANLTAEYSCMNNAYLTDGVRGGQIPCGTPHTLPKGTVSLLLKAASESKTDQTTTITLSASKIGERPSIGTVRFIVFPLTPREQETAQVSVNIKENKRAIDGTGADLFTLVFERPAGVSVQAKYACPTIGDGEVYLQAQGGGRIRCNDFLRLPPATKELTLSAVHTGNTIAAVGLEFIFTDMHGRKLLQPTIPITIRPQARAAPQERDALITGLSQREIAGNGTETATLSWIKPQNRNMYARYELPDEKCRSGNVFLFVAEPGGGKDNPIGCNKDILLPENRNSLPLGAINTGTQNIEVVVRLLSKEIFQPYAEKGRATYHLAVLPKESPLAATTESIISGLDRREVVGNEKDTVRLTWKNKPGRTVYARYECASDAYLIVAGQSAAERIPCDREFALTSGEALDLATVHTGNTPTDITISLLLRENGGARAAVGRATYRLAIQPPQSDIPSRSDVIISGLSFPDIYGNGWDVVSLTWRPARAGYSLYARYTSSQDSVFLIPAASVLTPPGGRIPTDREFSLSAMESPLRFAAVNPSESDARITIQLTLRNASGETIDTREHALLVQPPALFRREIIGDGQDKMRFTWANKPGRTVYARYECASDAYLIVAGQSAAERIPCDREIRLTFGEAIELAAVHAGETPTDLTFNFIFKERGADGTESMVARSTEKLHILPKGSIISRQEPFITGLSKRSISGNAQETVTLTWKNAPDRRVFARYDCMADNVYLVVSGTDAKARIPCDRDIPLSTTEESLDLLAVNSGEAGVDVKIVLTRRNAQRSSDIRGTATYTLEVRPAIRRTRTESRSIQTQTAETAGATSTVDNTIVLPLLSTVQVTTQRVTGDARASTTLLWSARPGAQVSASYICMKDAYMIVAGTTRDATIPCGTSFTLSANVLNLSAVNNATSTATTTITIFVEDATRGERRGVRIPLWILPDPSVVSVGTESSFSRMLNALLYFFLR